MTPARSAGILLYRSTPSGLEVLLGHMGGPYFAGKETGAWTIPKGEYSSDEDPYAAAMREFEEEFGAPPPEADYVPLGSIRQRNGKVVTAWAAEADFDETTIVSNTFEIEWPPRSKRRQAFPEIDRAAWFDVEQARPLMIAGQGSLLDLLLDQVG